VKHLLSMKKHTICVLGGTGFVGRHLVNLLAASGHRVRVASRHRERHRELLVLPTVQVVDANIHDAQVLGEFIAGCDTVINLVAILNETGPNKFHAVHVALPRQIALACREQGVKRLLHMSALNADAEHGVSRYLQSKGEGEDAVHAAADEELRVTSFRPSVIFGPGDHLFNQFAMLLKSAPGILPLPCPDARFAPVYVGDVIHAFNKALDDKATYGQRYELCGPRVYTMRELMSYAARVVGVKRELWGLSNGLSRLQAVVMQLLPGKPFTMDNYRSLQVDEFPSLFKLKPTAVETVVPYYLGRRDQHAMFDAIRVQARHDY
jgi:uncharacterized protein YbjT (DUF2867 family)